MSFLLFPQGLRIARLDLLKLKAVLVLSLRSHIQYPLKFSLQLISLHTIHPPRLQGHLFKYTDIHLDISEC